MSDLPPPPPPPSPGYPAAPNPADYASWVQRVLAYVVDYIPAFILGFIGYWLLFLSAGGTSISCDQTTGECTTSTSSVSGVPLVIGIICLLAALVYWIWNRVWKMGTTGSSIGMGVIGTKAVKEATGEPLGFGVNLLRQILLAVDFWICYIGVLWPLWDSKHQCLISDKATGAVVLPTK